MGRTTIGLLGSTGCGLLFAALAIVDLIWLDLHSTRSADESLFVTIGGDQAAIAIVGIIMIAVVLVWTRLGYVTSRRNLAVVNMGVSWTYVAANRIIVYAVLSLSPYVF